MADKRFETRLDQPRDLGSRWRLGRAPIMDEGAFGVWSERFARFMGTPRFLIGMTIFVVVWLAWNTFMPAAAQFDPRELNYTLLTLILSLQASYAAPLLLLAQNRQDDRDRVALEQDRARDERNLADTEFLTREVAALRISLREAATRDYVRSELRDLLDELEERGMIAPAPPPVVPSKSGARRKRKKKSKAKTPTSAARPSPPAKSTAPATATSATSAASPSEPDREPDLAPETSTDQPG